MSHESEVRARLLKLHREMLDEVAAIDALAERIGALCGPEGDRRADQEGRWAVLAVKLHGYYTAVESTLLRVARALEGGPPASPDWHRELLQEAARDYCELRPPVLSAASVAWLSDLLRFRHFFRNAYSVDLDGARLGRNASLVGQGHARLAAELRDFASGLVSPDR